MTSLYCLHLPTPLVTTMVNVLVCEFVDFFHLLLYHPCPTNPGMFTTSLRETFSDHAMVNFVKPNLLGTAKEFSNRFANPIKNGQHSNSTQLDVQIMKKRAHVLYKTLDGCVQVSRSIIPYSHSYFIKSNPMSY